jgi:SpoVK/Ycf46/Vps4 family AAA+-type ATPase
MARTLGTLLNWLSCKTSEVYVVGTSNNTSSLPPELTRSGRFDGVFFLDLPFAEQRQAIWQIYRNKYEISLGDELPDDTEWTGAEIEQCCYMACLQGKTLRQAAEYVIPVNRSAGTKIDIVRDYANGSLIDANFGGPYSKERYRNLREQEKIKSQPAAKRELSGKTSRRTLVSQDIFGQN